MELKKQDIGVWVKASEELPQIEDKYFVRFIESGARAQVYFNGKRFETYIQAHPEIEWLKPIKDVYVLTEDELEKSHVDFADWLVKEMKVEPVGGMWEVLGVEHVFEDGKTAICPVRSTGFLYKQFIKSITK